MECFIRYQHDNVVVTKSIMPCAWVLIIVQHIEGYNQINQLMTASVGMSNGDSNIIDCSEHEEYQKHTWKSFHKNITLQELNTIVIYKITQLMIYTTDQSIKIYIYN